MFPPPIEALVGELAGAVQQPLQGLTSDGTVRPGLFPLRSTGVSTAPITDAASHFLGALSAEQRQRAVFPPDAEERRMWLNIHPFVFRHGVMLEDLPPATRQLGLRLLEASLSARGFAQARDIMRLNRLLAEVTGLPDDFGEWPYFLSFYGEPSADRPWAWQIDGHHLCLNGTVIGDQFLLTPSFMGSEPCQVFDGPLAGTMVFTAEERAGLDLIRSLDDRQAAQAVLRPSIYPEDLPPELQDPLDGRIQAGAFRGDNAVVAYAGVCAADLTGIQRRCLRALTAAYVGWTGEGHSGVKMSEVDQRLDETYFAWMGAVADDGPSLAILLRALGDLQTARELDEDTFARHRRLVGEDDRQTLRSASNLANDLYCLGEIQAARELQEGTLIRRRRVLGEDHPGTLRSASNLAEDLRALGEA